MAFDLESFALAIIHALVSIFISLAAVYGGMYAYMASTRGIDEWKELKKKNVAIGITTAGAIIAVAIIIAPSVSFSLAMFSTLSLPALLARFVVAVLNTAIAVLIASFSIYISIRFINNLTPEIDEMGELKAGNVAVALYMGAIMVAIAFLASSSVIPILNSLGLFSYVLSMGN